MILLQLAYIPDVVIQEVDFTQGGWSLDFKQKMDEYKQKFEQEHKREWVYQCRETEDEYIAHVSKLDP